MPKCLREDQYSLADEGRRCNVPDECELAGDICSRNNDPPEPSKTETKGYGNSEKSRNNDKTTLNVKSTNMGCSFSSNRNPSCFDGTGDAFQHAISNGMTGRTHVRVEKMDSTASSSGDEELTVDQLGRQTASDADLINAQRSEKTDITWGLEDRWLRSHFSGAKAIDVQESTGSEARVCEIANRQEIIGADAQDTDHHKTIGAFGSARDLHIQTSLENVTVSSDSHVSYEKEPPKDIARHLCILHFNDVYELTERKKDPVGGASRFSNLFESVLEKAKRDCDGQNPFIVFGGDCLNPSILSSATKGKHMIDVLNLLKINAAVFGNHEFDFGVDHAADCIAKMDATWFISNVTDKFNGKPLADGVISHIFEWGAFKIGIIGLIEEEWLDTLATVDKCELVFQDYVTRGSELAKQLKANGADLVIALTHMRWPNDIRLAQKVKEVDLILGGHDHEYGVKLANDCVIVKSGCDFRTFSRVDLYFKESGEMDVRVVRYDVTSNTAENPEMKCIVDRYMNVLEKQLQEKIGTTGTDLNGLYEDVRSQETNLGNFVADIMRMTTRAEIVLINSGTFRSNAIHSRGKFRIRDLMSILPIHDNVVVIEVTGLQLLEGLENAVCKYPSCEGRFPQISGFCFGFDRNAPPKHRVVRESVLIRGQPLDLNRVYKLATKAYVARGKDGYECFSNCRLMNDPDSGPVLSTVVRNHISNVFQLLRHERATGNKMRVVEDGRKIISACGDIHEVYSSCFWQEDAPVYKLQKSMEDVVPKDCNHNVVLKNGFNGLKKNSKVVSDQVDGPSEGRAPHMQHLIEICRDRIFDKSEKVSDYIASQRRKSIQSNRANQELLVERQRSFEEVRWQVFPLLEGRIFHCAKI